MRGSTLPQPVDHGDPAADARARDADLVARLQRGETPAAFEVLVQRYQGKVFRLCASLLPDAAAAEDAAQESLLRVWRSLASYDPAAGALSTWIYAIARNRCLTAISRGSPRRLAEVSMQDDGVEEVAAQVAAPSPATAGGSGDLLRRLVDELPSAYRASLALYYFEDRSVAEAAAMLGLAEATFKTHLHRGRGLLLQRLRQDGLADPALWATEMNR
jgi:RNA polymerase sigma-70 factor, ECF subfamily